MIDMFKDRRMRHQAEIRNSCLIVTAALAMICLTAGTMRGAEPEPAIQAGAAKKPAANTAVTGKKAASPATMTGPKVPPVIGRRDPFKLPGAPVASTGGGDDGPIGPLPPGTRGLVIGRLRLEGIVRLDTTNTLIAIVDTTANRAYFLRENDPVYNGVVSKITPDSVIFRENALDSAGKLTIRDVVLRLKQGPGA